MLDNVAKPLTNMCQPGILWLEMLEESKALKCMGGGILVLDETQKKDLIPQVWN